MPATRTFTFLGTGTSVGVPMLGCDCAVCRSPDPRNQRYRCSALVQTPQGRILIDTPPELRLQLLRERAGFVHAILFTHFHADHLFGLDDVRPFARHLGGPVPLYCARATEQVIRRAFAYAFTEEAASGNGLFVPKLAFHTIGADPFAVLGERVVPIPLLHGGFDVLGFRFDDVAYCTDVSGIPESSWPRLEGLRVLVLDALRPHPHPGHFSLDQALEVIARLKPRRAYLTHMTHELEHEATNKRLPPGVELAYDGLSFEF
jgi:phosphoribosyl 1,2-cyclic phosphate phosphodiesterase